MKAVLSRDKNASSTAQKSKKPPIKANRQNAQKTSDPSTNTSRCKILFTRKTCYLTTLIIISPYFTSCCF